MSNLSIRERGDLLSRKVNYSTFFHILIAIYTVWLSVFGVWNFSVAGAPLFSMYLMAFGVILFSFSILKGVAGNKFVLVIFSVISIIVSLASVLKDWSVFYSFYNMLLYSLPILLFFLPSMEKIDLSKIVTYIQIMTFVAAFLCLLIVVGVVDSGLNVNISILKVDNTIGIVGVAASMYAINKEDRNKILSFGSLVAAIFIIISGQSRARMVYSAIIILLYILYMIFVAEKSRLKNTLIIIIVAFVAVMVVGAYSEQLNEYLGFVSGKFEELGEDSSSIYRQNEMGIHLREFAKNPFFGIGTGALNNEYKTELGEKIYGHNMYTAAFAFNGVFYALIFLGILFYAVFGAIKRFLKDKSNENMLALLLMLCIAILSATSGGFSKLGTHIAMLVVGTVFFNKKETSDLQDNGR